MVVRNAKIKDFQELVWDKNLEAWRDIVKKDLEESLQSKKLYLVAEIDHKIVGQIVVNTQKEIPYMSALRVQELFQNQGIGTTLVMRAEQELKKVGFNKVTIEVNINNHGAKRLYEKLGYVIKRQFIDRWNYKRNGEIKTFEEEVYELEKKLSS